MEKATITRGRGKLSFVKKGKSQTQRDLAALRGTVVSASKRLTGPCTARRSRTANRR